MIVYIDDITRNMFTVIDGVMVCGRFRETAETKPFQVTASWNPGGRCLWSNCEMVERRRTCWKTGWGRWRSDDESRAWDALLAASKWFELEQRAKCG